MKDIPEAFIHYLWKYRLIRAGVCTGSGDMVTVIHPGTHNSNAGPDFLCARVRIGDTLWVGNVEIHVKASDWQRHRHHRDESYNSVILHVVAENDCTVRTASGNVLQTLEIGEAFDRKLLSRYRDISQNLLWVACENMIGSVKRVHISSKIHALAIGRLYEKAEVIREELVQTNMDWEECCYRTLARQFGAKLNRQPFEMLARSLPASVIRKYSHSLFQLESLFFGQSGLLNKRLYGEYPRNLKKEHAYLALKHGLAPMPGYLWKFMRLRPAAFPTIRLAQMAELYSRAPVLQNILEAKDLTSLYKYFSLEASPYWTDHFLFDRKSIAGKKRLGRQSIQVILINAAIPLVCLYGQEMNRQDLCTRAVDLLESLPPEDNAIIRKWHSIGVTASNSLETQGLLQLKKCMCDNKACLECAIGHQILQQQL